jgi:hypothetical protein
MAEVVGGEWCREITWRSFYAFFGVLTTSGGRCPGSSNVTWGAPTTSGGRRPAAPRTTDRISASVVGEAKKMGGESINTAGRRLAV